MRKAKAPRILTFTCSFLLCAAFVGSVFITGNISVLNVSFVLFGFLIAYFEAKKFVAGKVMSGIVFSLSGLVIPLGYLNPMDGNIQTVSSLHIAGVFIIAAMLLLAATVCLRR